MNDPAQQAPGGGIAGVEPRHFRTIMAIIAVMSVILILATIFLPPHLQGLTQSADQRTDDYNLTLIVFTVLAAPVFSLVVAFVVYSIFRWRVRGRPVDDGPPIRASRGIQVVWVATSAVLVALLFAWGLVFLNRADAAPGPNANVLTVYVTGEQWNWNYTYPQYNNAQSDVLEVPVNRPILFKITSIDVDHSFSVPAFAVKEDAVPGQFTYIRATPNKMGTYAVRCYELCGLFHAYMQSQVRVVSDSDFSSWVSQQPRVTNPWGTAGAGIPGTNQ